MEESELIGIEDLPDEILINVFSYLTLTEMLQSVPLVCKHWNAVSRDPSLYRHLVFLPTNPPTNVAVQMVEIATLLTSLRLTDRNDADEILGQVGSRHPGLKTLVVHYCKGTPGKRIVSSRCVLNIVNHCDKLESLSLAETCCGSVELYKEIGLKLPRLRTIDFGYTEEYFSEEAILNVVNNCHGVERLHVFHCTQISGEVMSAFCNEFHASLRVLDVIPVSWTDASLDALSRCSNLTAIELIFARAVTDQGIMAIATMPNLEEVSIWGACRVSAQCWIDFFTSPATRAIKWLCLQYCQNVTDEVGYTIARELRGLVDLRLISNSNTWEGRVEIRRLLPFLCQFSL